MILLIGLLGYNFTLMSLNRVYSSVSPECRDKKGWTQRLGLANVSPKGLYHGIRGWFKLDSGS